MSSIAVGLKTVDGRHDFFGHDGQASFYAQFRPTYPPEIYKSLISRVRQCRRAGQGRLPLALDVACGSGQATYALAQWFDRVVGVDQSLEQLKHAKQTDPLTGTGKVEYAAGTAYDLRAIGGEHTADLVSIAQAMHWLELNRFFEGAALALQPGGVLAALGYGVPYLEDTEAQSVFQRYYVETLGSEKEPGEPGCFWEVSRPLLDSGFSRLEGFGTCFAPAGEKPGGFQREWFLVSSRQQVGSFIGYLRSWSGYRTYMSQLASGLPDPLDSLPQKMGFVDLDDEVSVTFPFFLLTAARV